MTMSAVSSTHEFDRLVVRRGSNSLKWDGAHHLLTQDQSAANPLPMWVADMDFQAPQSVLDALKEAVDFGVFGYPLGLTPSYLTAVTGWQQKRFGWNVDPDWVVPVSGVITALKTAIQTFSSPGDSVLIQPPVYAHFHNDVVMNGRTVTAAPLRCEGGRYHFDVRTFEAAVKDNTKLFILSNPHNPTGNVWTEDELRTMGEICRRQGVLVVSDEIHQDFILAPGKRHIPFASLGREFSDNSITCISASKTFNLAGLQCANAITTSKRLRDEFARQVDRSQFSRVNLLGMIATETAYRDCEHWVDRLVAYVSENQRHFAEAINSSNIGLHAIEMDSLYLSWIDCRDTGMTPSELEDHMLIKANVWLDKGPKFGVEGAGFMRANLGCPRLTVDEAVRRIQSSFNRC
jgi:cysteine-S-conjugate beta-lyase